MDHEEIGDKVKREWVLMLHATTALSLYLTVHENLSPTLSFDLVPFHLRLKLLSISFNLSINPRIASTSSSQCHPHLLSITNPQPDITQNPTLQLLRSILPSLLNHRQIIFNDRK